MPASLKLLVGFTLLSKERFLHEFKTGDVVGAFYVFNSRQCEFVYRVDSDCELMAWGISKERIKHVFKRYIP